jgi:hypothetical protein
VNLRIYVGRPAPDGEPEPRVSGRPHTFRSDGRTYWLVAAYAARPPRAMDALLFHADRRTHQWLGRGWTDTRTPDGLTHELWSCDINHSPRVAVARVTETELIAAQGFVELLAHRSLDAAVSTYAATATVVSGFAPRRITTLTRTIREGEHLVPAQGAHT